MPTPLGPEPDVTPIHEQVRVLMRDAHTKQRMATVGIVFSQEGYEQALRETVPGMGAWGPQPDGGGHPHYLGYPVRVEQGNPFAKPVMLDLAPGGSAEARAARDAMRAAGPQVNKAAIQVRVEKLGDKPTIELMAEGLTKPQLCDLLIAWCTANRHDAMVPGIKEVVRQHGRFE